MEWRKKTQALVCCMLFIAPFGTMRCIIKGRVSDGQLVSHRQPKLVTGGVLRDYQLDGLDWLRVSHCI